MMSERSGMPDSVVVVAMPILYLISPGRPRRHWRHPTPPGGTPVPPVQFSIIHTLFAQENLGTQAGDRINLGGVEVIPTLDDDVREVRDAGLGGGGCHANTVSDQPRSPSASLVSPHTSGGNCGSD